MTLLDAYSVALEGAEAVVVGRSDLVGKPVAFLLLERNATVTMCHSRTRDLAGVCARADVLGGDRRAEMIGPEYVKPGAAVIDVGINRTDDGLKGDVPFERRPSARDHARAGGVGPMTIAMLLRNTVMAASLGGGRGGEGQAGARSRARGGGPRPRTGRCGEPGPQARPRASVP